MAEGTSYAIVPYMMPEDLPVVSAVVGAGGTLGAVIATWCFYKFVEDPLVPFRLHAGYVLFWALTVFAMRWEHLGSMFGRAQAAEAARAPKPETLVQPTNLTDLENGTVAADQDAPPLPVLLGRTTSAGNSRLKSESEQPWPVLVATAFL